MSANAVPSDWPTPWELTTPESHVLEYRGCAFRDQPFRLAVKELVMRRALRIERIEVRRLLRPALTHALTDGPLIGRELPRPLAAVLAVYRGAPKRRLEVLREGSTVAVPIEGVTEPDLAGAARREFGKTERYRELHVVPALMERGLLARTGSEGRVRHREVYDWTTAGRQADAELQDWLALGRQNLARWAESDLARGVVYAEGAGAALLLMDDLYPELERLGSRAAVAGGGGGGDGLYLDFVGLDFGGLDLGGDGSGGGCGGGCGA